MTQPAPDTLEAEKEKLFLKDAELIRRMGVPMKLGYAVLAAYDRDRSKGFPPKQAIWGDRRYWPAVKAFLDRAGGLTMPVPQRRNGSHG